MARLGFYDYKQAVVGLDGVIFKEDMTSLPTYATEQGAGTITYGANGFTGVANAAVYITGVPDQADMAVEGTFSCMVSKEAFTKDHIPAAAENFFNITGGTSLFTNHQESIGYIAISCNGAMDDTETGNPANCRSLQASLSGDMVNVIYTWDQSGLQIWWDYALMFNVPWNGTLRTDFSTFRVNGSTTNAGTYTWGNILLSTKKMIIPTSKAVNTIHVYGDSYAQQGQYPVHGTNDRWSWSARGYTENGTDFDTEDGKTATVGYNGNADWFDAGMFISMQRALAKNELYTPKIRNWAYGGAGIETAGADGNDVAERVTTALSGNYPMPDVCVIVAGYNDATNALTTMEASWQTMIDEIVSANANVKIIVTTLPFHDHASFGPTLNEVQAYNVIINAIGDDNAEVTIVDQYTNWGGADDGGADLGYWNTDHIHPSALGQDNYGKNIAAAITRAVS